MAQWLYSFWREEDGQDLIEYSLLITFIALACAAIMGGGKPAVNIIWTKANDQLSSAGAVASGS